MDRWWTATWWNITRHGAWLNHSIGELLRWNKTQEKRNKILFKFRTNNIFIMNFDHCFILKSKAICTKNIMKCRFNTALKWRVISFSVCFCCFFNVSFVVKFQGFFFIHRHLYNAVQAKLFHSNTILNQGIWMSKVHLSRILYVAIQIKLEHVNFKPNDWRNKCE